MERPQYGRDYGYDRPNYRSDHTVRGYGDDRRGDRGDEGRVHKKSDPNAPREPSQVQIFVEGLPRNVQLQEVVEYFSTVGKIKLDRETRQHRIWLYRDKQTREPTGEATVTYLNRESQKLALQTYDGQIFRSTYYLKVTPAIVKSHMASPPILPPRPPRGRGGRGGRGGGRGGGPGRGFGGRGRQEGYGSRGNSNYTSLGSRDGQSSGYGSVHRNY